MAAIHFTPSGKSPESNCEEFAPLVAEASRQRADLVVLGETIPYVRVSKKPHELAEGDPGSDNRIFRPPGEDISDLHIVLSLYERDDDVVYNTAVLLGPDGDLMGRYRKVCLPHSEIDMKLLLAMTILFFRRDSEDQDDGLL